MRPYRFLPAAGLVALVALATAPGQTQAQITIPSTMSATCANASCSQLRFFLDFSDSRTLYLKWFEINAAGAWRFGGLNSVMSAATATNVTSNFQTQLFNGNVQMSGVDMTQSLPIEPVVITTDMSVVGVLSDLDSFDHRGQACFSVRCGASDPADVGFTGTVDFSATPEPATTLLLLSGLVGVGGAAARKRRRKADVA